MPSSRPDITALTAVEAPPRQHLPEIDILRGAAILLVLYLHSYFSAWPEVTEGERFWVALSHLIAHGAVPCFLFISGFLLARDRSRSFQEFVSGRMRRIALPGLTWMFLALGYESWRAGGLTSELLRRFALFDIQGQFYFLFVLGVLMAAAYPLRRAPVRVIAPATAGAFVVGLLAIGWYERQEMAGDFAVLAYRNPAIWAFFFLFGLLAQRLQGDIAWGSRVERGAAVGLLATTLVYLWQGQHGGYPTSYFGVTVYLASGFGLVVYPAVVRATLRSALGRAAVRPLALLAPFAFGVFLVHKPYFLGWFSSEALMGTSAEESWGRLMLANFLLGAVASIASVVVVDRLSRRAASMFLGVERPRRTRGSTSEDEPARAA